MCLKELYWHVQIDLGAWYDYPYKTYNRGYKGVCNAYHMYFKTIKCSIRWSMCFGNSEIKINKKYSQVGYSRYLCNRFRMYAWRAGVWTTMIPWRPGISPTFFAFYPVSLTSRFRIHMDPLHGFPKTSTGRLLSRVLLQWYLFMYLLSQDCMLW